MLRIFLAAVALAAASAAQPQMMPPIDRAAVIDNAARLIEQRYVDRAMGRRLARDLRR